MKGIWIPLLVILFFLTAVAQSGEDEWMKKIAPKEPPGSIRKESSNSRTPTTPQSSSNVDPFSGVVDVHDYYKAGEIRVVMEWSSYYYAIYPQMKERIAEHHDLFKKIKVSDATLALFDQTTAMLLTLPWDKDYNQWPEDAKNKWITNPDWVKFANALNKELNDNIYYWLGNHTMNLVWTLQRIMPDNTLNAEAISKLTGAATDCSWISEQSAFSTLTPEVQAAIKTIAAMKGKSNPNDPFAKAFQQTDVDQMKQAAAAIRQVAQNQKLVS
jgi:hypothetical protein